MTYEHSTMDKRTYSANVATKDARARVAAVVESVNETDRGVAQSLADELVFMSGTLATLRQYILDHGAVAVDDRTGAVKESPAVRSYNAMVPRYASIVKQLCKMGEAGANQVDPLLAFIEGETEDDDED